MAGGASDKITRTKLTTDRNFYHVGVIAQYSATKQPICSADLTYLIIPCQIQTLLQSPPENLVYFQEWWGKIHILPSAYHV
jgi:hypothetical protein